MNKDFILELVGVTKKFSGVTVLKDVDFKVSPGEVRGIVGANGAGKSTMMKIIGGVHKPTIGKMYLKGEEVEFNSPKDAQEHKIGFVYQELSLIPTLDVISNVFISREKTNSFRLIDTKQLLKKYEKISQELNFDIPPFAVVSELSIAKQQMVEIMKTVSQNSEIIIMDEPTASLTEKEKENLFNIIRTLKSKGKTILYISHMLDELFQLTDSITVLRDGHAIGTYFTKELSKEKVADLMMGEENQGEKFHKKSRNVRRNTIPVLELNDLGTNKIHDVNLKLYKGEILGLAGLMGAGRTELARAIFGQDTITSGDFILEGEKINIDSPKTAISKGIGLIPEDRKNVGLIPKHEVYKNATIINLREMLKGNFLDKKKELTYTHDAVDKLKIKVNDINSPVRNLSGGNQQKVVVSKWLGLDMKVLIFDEPTKGIDVSAKEDIFKIIDDFAQKGVSIIFISSDLEEVTRISDRVLVMRKGTIVSELKDDEINIKNIMYAALNV